VCSAIWFDFLFHFNSVFDCLLFCFNHDLVSVRCLSDSWISLVLDFNIELNPIEKLLDLMISVLYP